MDAQVEAKLLKQKMFEMNTSKPAGAIKPKEEASAEITSVVAQLPAYFKEDTRQLDALLGTGYYGKWFAEWSSQCLNKDGG